jgi:hypothetical protein
MFNGMPSKNRALITKYSDLSVLQSTPVIVNPFEHLTAYPTPRDKSPAGCVAEFVVGKPEKDASKGRPNAACKQRGKGGAGKKGKDGKTRPSSSTSRATSAGKKKGGKHKEGKVGEDGSRPKSGKRTRSGKRRKSKAERALDKEAELLAQVALKGNMALISGIGWHLATECSDVSDVLPARELHLDSDTEPDSDHLDSDASDVESIEDAETLMQKMSLPHGSASVASPRFREIKTPREHLPPPMEPLHAVTNDGFPPMNLDMTHRHYAHAHTLHGSPGRENLKLLPADFTGEEDLDSPGAEAYRDVLRKLTPIPEMPSLTSPLDNVNEAIARFDRSMKASQLNDMLETPRTTEVPQLPSKVSSSVGTKIEPLSVVVIPETESASFHTYQSTPKDSTIGPKQFSDTPSSTPKQYSAGSVADNTPKNSATISRDSSTRSSADRVATKPPLGDASVASSASSRHSGRNSLRTQSLKDPVTLGSGSHNSSGSVHERHRTSSVRKERKFSESKRDREEIDKAIDEILSTTNTSISDTLRSDASALRSASNTLTEGDRNLLLKLKSAKDSPFYASRRSDSDDSPATPIGEVSSGKGLTSDTNLDLLKVIHVDKYDLGAKVKVMIEAGASEEKIKAMIEADDEADNLEARQLVKVRNGFYFFIL